MLRKSNHPLPKTSSQKNLDLHVLANSSTTPQSKENEMLSRCCVLKQCPRRWERLPTAGKDGSPRHSNAPVCNMVYLHQRLQTLKASLVLHSSPKMKPKTLTSMPMKNFPLQDMPQLLALSFFFLATQVKVQGEMNSDSVQDSGNPACGVLKWFGCFFFCWVTLQAEGEEGSKKSWA